MDIVAPPPVIFIFTVLIALLMQFCFPISVFPASRWLWLASGALFIIAGTVAFWAIRTMLLTKNSPNPYQKVNNLTTKGPYHYSRNPIYMAMLGSYLSLTLLFNSLWLLLLLPALLLLLYWGVIVREEAYLEAEFGDQYLQYKKCVRRWL